MKINIFLENYHKGGLDRFVTSLICDWPVQGDVFTILCNSNHPGLEELRKLESSTVSLEVYNFFLNHDYLQKEISVTGFKKFIQRLTRSFVLRILINPFLLFWYFFRVRSIYYSKKNQRLLVVNGGYPASLLGRISVLAWRSLGGSNKAILTIHGVPRYVGGINYLWDRILDFIVLKSSESIVCVSHAVYRELITRSPFRLSKKVVVISNGIRDPLKNLDSSLGSPFRFDYCLTLGTLQKAKGHSFLINAFSRISSSIPNLHLVILGTGSPLQEELISSEISRFGLSKKVHRVQYLDQPFLYINFARLIFVPSQEPEAFGLVALEAMSLSKPLVTTDAGSLRDLVTQDIGLTAPVGDLEGFVRNSLLILNSEALASYYGANGRRKFESSYTASDMCQKYASILGWPRESDSDPQPM
jgi:glycosyltransferase involved in cell wall biosynthesis